MPRSDDEYHALRSEALQRILGSSARLKLIVAGPGTGKTFTFQRVLDNTDGRGIAMTFLLGLVSDLHEAIGETTDVYSFHGFARRLLQRVDGTGISRGAAYYPPLTRLLVEDLRIVDGEVFDELQLGGLFRNLAGEDEFLVRALASGEYYDSASYDDAVYRVLMALEDDAARIPRYPQIVVDEFQDFCPLEVQIVKVLATKSPTLIVGDDDQALYAFRDAQPEAIRELAGGREWERFELPFCTRCTEVVVEATHAVVRRAQRAGLLEGRLDKPFECFLPEKRAESAAYPTIVHAHCSTQTSRAPYMGRYIAEAIAAIPAEDIAESHSKKFPTVLVIGPQPFLGQVESYLRQHFGNILTSSHSAPELQLADAYRFLAADPNSNLGWRILLQLLMPASWERAVRDSLAERGPLRDRLSGQFVERHLAVANLLRRLLAGEELAVSELQELAQALESEPDQLEVLIHPPESPAPEPDPGEPTIMLTSLMGSKGLQAAHVFVVGVNAGHFPRHGPTDEEVCQLLVALTRTRKSCTVVSTGRLGAAQLGESRFIGWLGPHLETIHVNQQYFSSRACER